jgi:hypothetical protein
MYLTLAASHGSVMRNRRSGLRETHRRFAASKRPMLQTHPEPIPTCWRDVARMADRLVNEGRLDDAQDLVRQAVLRFIDDRRIEPAFRLMSVFRLPAEPGDARLSQTRTVLLRYEVNRVVKVRRRLVCVLGGVLCYLFLISPSVFVALENPYRLSHMMSELDWSEGLYWSVITSTTVGYGDLVPFTPFGRMFALFNALLGVLLAGVVAGLILGALTARRLD